LTEVILSPWWRSLDFTDARSLYEMFTDPIVWRIRDLIRANVAADYELDIHDGHGRSWESVTAHIITIVMMGAQPLSHVMTQSPEAFGETIIPLPPPHHSRYLRRGRSNRW
jgi:hypothetical protein